MNLNQNIDRIENAKASIKASIEAKGVVVGADEKIDTYAAKIDSIQSQPILQEKSVVANGPVTPDAGYDGLSKVDVNVPVPSEPVTTLRFRDFPGLKMANYSGVSVPDNFDLNGIADMSNFFKDSELTTVPLFDFSPTTSVYYLFYNSKIEEIPLLDFSNMTSMIGTFRFCKKLRTIPAINTSKVYDVVFLFDECESLVSLPELDFSSVTSAGWDGFVVGNSWQASDTLKTLGGFKGMRCTINLKNHTGLDKESIMNVINKVAQADPAIDNGTPKLTLSAASYTLLSEADIAIATDKGWTVVQE